MSGVSSRPAAPEDAEYLRLLFAEIREELFAPLNLPEQELQALIDMQYAARNLDYGGRYPLAVHSIILASNEPVGAMIVNYGEDEIRLVDFMVERRHRGRGFGTAILQSLLSEAEDLQKPVGFCVEPFNPAKRLYERMGFKQVAADETACWMRWEPHADRAG